MKLVNDVKDEVVRFVKDLAQYTSLAEVLAIVLAIFFVATVFLFACFGLGSLLVWLFR